MEKSNELFWVFFLVYFQDIFKTLSICLSEETKSLKMQQEIVICPVASGEFNKQVKRLVFHCVIPAYII